MFRNGFPDASVKDKSNKHKIIINYSGLPKYCVIAVISCYFMDNKLLLKGMVKGFEDMGGKFIKVDHFDFFFEIKKGSEIDNDEKLKRAKNAFFSQFGLGLKIRRV